MIKAYSSICKEYPFIILTLGFAYGATIVFTFFGPVLAIAAGDAAPFLSIIAVVFHVLGFFLKPTRLEQQPQFFCVSLLLLLPLVLLFHIIPYYLQVITAMLYAYMIGRIGCFWTYISNRVIVNYLRGKIISAALFIAFAILFFVNLSSPLLTKQVALILPVVLSSIAVYAYLKLVTKYKNTVVINKEIMKSEISPYFIFVFLSVVYIAGGFSYGGIYPSFAPYEYIDRYYNVFFFLIAIISAGIILDKYGRKIAFMLGVGFLGISFTFFIMPSSVLTYLITQTFLQSGWAFVNAFGWSFSWDIAERSRQDSLFPRGIAAMLLGASIGALIAQVFENSGWGYPSVYGLVTFIPLFTALILLVFFPETLKINDKREFKFAQLQQCAELKALTPRELEVCYHLLQKFSNKSISTELFISENTVKTHIRRIYGKLNVASREELKTYIDELL
ncbi:MAG: helix-turn-helix transcriptional regulator [Peptococcaceae bacterium]